MSTLAATPTPATKLPIRIGKVTRSNGTVRLHMIASDTKPDMYQTKMSLRLYENFIRRRAAGEFEPYLGVSHYTTPIGEIERLLIDGRYLKYTAVLGHNPLAEYVADRLHDPAYRERLCSSIGFDDYDSYRDATLGDTLVYTDGLLIHNALTFIPANPRSRLVALEMRKFTQYDDALEVAGPTFASWLEDQERSRSKARL